MASPKLKQFYRQGTKRLVDILKQYQPEKIILFGSCVQGNMHPGSDVDLCLIKEFRGLKIDQKQKFSRLLRDNDYSYRIEPDFHIYKPEVFHKELKEGHPFIEEINNIGQVIYEKQT